MCSLMKQSRVGCTACKLLLTQLTLKYAYERGESEGGRERERGRKKGGIKGKREGRPGGWNGNYLLIWSK